MGKGINKVIIVGNLGNDPDLRYSGDGKAIANLSIATSEMWKDKNTGEQQQRTEWHRVVFFGRTAEVCGEYLQKGSMVFVEGKLQTRKWQDQNGNDRYSTEVMGNEMQMLGGTKEKSAPPQDYRGHSGSNQGNPASQAPAATQSRQNSAPQPSNEFDDDIPY